MSKQFSKLSKSHKSTEYGTPLDLYQKLNKIFEFKFDPCTTKDNPLGTDMYCTTEHDGLDGPWNNNTFINPPFGRGVLEWIQKMKHESEQYNHEYVYVMLLPARTDTKWFQDHIMTDEHDAWSCIYLLNGRLKFINPELNQKSQPHIIGSMLWIKNSSTSQRKALMQTINGVMLFEWDKSGYWRNN